MRAFAFLLAFSAVAALYADDAVNVGYNRGSNAYGLKLSIMPTDDENVRVNGLALGLLSSAARDVRGFQGAPFCCYAGRVSGAQTSLVCVAGDHCGGFQMALVNAASEGFRGFQLGVVNYASGKGVQLGLVNYMEGAWVPCLPLVNFSFKEEPPRVAPAPAPAPAEPEGNAKLKTVQL